MEEAPHSLSLYPPPRADPGIGATPLDLGSVDHCDLDSAESSRGRHRGHDDEEEQERDSAGEHTGAKSLQQVSQRSQIRDTSQRPQVEASANYV